MIFVKYLTSSEAQMLVLVPCFLGSSDLVPLVLTDCFAKAGVIEDVNCCFGAGTSWLMGRLWTA